MTQRMLSKSHTAGEDITDKLLDESKEDIDIITNKDDEVTTNVTVISYSVLC